MKQGGIERDLMRVEILSGVLSFLLLEDEFYFWMKLNVAENHPESLLDKVAEG